MKALICVSGDTFPGEQMIPVPNTIAFSVAWHELGQRIASLAQIPEIKPTDSSGDTFTTSPADSA